MNSEDGSLLCWSTAIFLFYNRMQLKHKQTKCEHNRRNFYRFSVGITIINQTII